MSKKRKKIIKMRGSKTCGYGAKKKHRGKGSKGGKGYAGIWKHKKSMIIAYEPDHVGKRGFKPKNRKEIKAINLSDIQKLKEDCEIFLKEFGYDKVLAKGELKKPLIIHAKSFSKKAIEKIEKVGGKAVIE
jgi:large subunit ribosomal protein L15